MRIVWLKTELLHPVDRGGRIRTHAMLRALRQKHEVTYVALDDGRSAPDAVEKSVEYAQKLVRIPHVAHPRRSLQFLGQVAQNLVSSEPFSGWRFRSPQMRAYLEGLSPADADVIVCDFLFPAVNVPEPSRLPTVLFQHNVEAVIWERLAKNAGSLPSRLYYGLQAKRLADFEGYTCRRMDHVIAVSKEDRDSMRSRYGATRVDDVPTGVDTEFFKPAGRAARDPDRIVFMGAMDWLPNEDGVAFFLDEILPKVRAKRPSATVTIVGRNPSDAMRARCAAMTGVEVTGTVPDVRPHLERGAVFVVPLRIGGGTRLKIFEAMGMEVPTVATRIGAEGLPLSHGQELLLADEPGDFADACVRLLENPAEAAALAHRAATRVRAEFGWSAAADRFAALCRAAIEHHTSTASPPASFTTSAAARKNHA